MGCMLGEAKSGDKKCREPLPLRSEAERGKYGEAGMGAGSEGIYEVRLELNRRSAGESDSPPTSQRFALIHFPRKRGKMGACGQTFSLIRIARRQPALIRAVNTG